MISFKISKSLQSRERAWEDHEFLFFWLVYSFKNKQNCLQFLCVNSQQQKGLFGATDDTAAAATFSSTFEPSVYICIYFGCLDVTSKKVSLYTSGFVELFLYFVKDRRIWGSDWLQGGVSVTVVSSTTSRSILESSNSGRIRRPRGGVRLDFSKF